MIVIKLDMDITSAAPIDNDTLTIGIIDSYQLSQEYLVVALNDIEPKPDITCFYTLQDYSSSIIRNFDLIIYFAHFTDASERALLQDISAIREALPTTPVVVLSDAKNAKYAQTLRGILENGAQGFIPVRTTGLSVMLEAICFVAAGGVFAPLDLLLNNQSLHRAETAQRSRLTPRQHAVLSHLQEGKSNKVIAYELNMSESTVKVHVRNIMRRTGATNRTQAVYKTQSFDSAIEWQTP